MAAIPTTYGAISSHIFQRRAKANITNDYAPLQYLPYQHKLMCSAGGRHVDFGRQRSLPYYIKVGKPSMRRNIAEDSSAGARSVIAGNGSADATTILRTIARLMNRSTKWVLLTVVLCVLIRRYNSPEVLWAVTGSILNGGSSKPLKRLINQPRPASAFGFKKDPGMPSSHAQNLGYVSAYALFIWMGISAVLFLLRN